VAIIIVAIIIIKRNEKKDKSTPQNDISKDLKKKPQSVKTPTPVRSATNKKISATQALARDGEIRKELGEHLVIVSHHSSACEICKKFENKILIDDVYSGGSRKDGNYMLLSEAMAQGLFHEGCRHGLGTYYPELESINHYSKTAERKKR
jgi:hypothetical protein